MLMDGACRCLAYAHVVHESLWLEFVTKAHCESAGVVSWHMVRLAVCTALRVSYLISQPPNELPQDGREGGSVASRMYRIKQYLSATRESTPDETSPFKPGALDAKFSALSKKRNKFLNTQMETAISCQETIKVWILVLTNLFKVQHCQDEDRVFFRQESGGCRNDYPSASKRNGSTIGKYTGPKDASNAAGNEIAVLSKAARDLVISSRHCTSLEDTIIFAKAVAMINYHLPEREEEEEAADMSVRAAGEGQQSGQDCRLPRGTEV